MQGEKRAVRVVLCSCYVRAAGLMHHIGANPEEAQAKAIRKTARVLIEGEIGQAEVLGQARVGDLAAKELQAMA